MAVEELGCETLKALDLEVEAIKALDLGVKAMKAVDLEVDQKVEEVRKWEAIKAVDLEVDQKAEVEKCLTGQLHKMCLNMTQCTFRSYMHTLSNTLATLEAAHYMLFW